MSSSCAKHHLNVKHVLRRVLTFLDIQCIRLWHWHVWSPDLSPDEYICSWVAERQAYHPSPDNTVEVCPNPLQLHAIPG
ncbi:hypothetical protein TNCV_1794241 [Trichonephila clavipes]|nr:hypothetical protein TNCV_1794241 [Trichonephila clavipes]